MVDENGNPLCTRFHDRLDFTRTSAYDHRRRKRSVIVCGFPQGTPARAVWSDTVLFGSNKSEPQNGDGRRTSSHTDAQDRLTRECRACPLKAASERNSAMAVRKNVGLSPPQEPPYIPLTIVGAKSSNTCTRYFRACEFLRDAPHKRTFTPWRVGGTDIANMFVLFACASTIPSAGSAHRKAISSTACCPCSDTDDT